MFQEYIFFEFLKKSLQEKQVWSSCLSIASNISWENWKERTEDFQLLETKFDRFASDFIELSDNENIELERALRNAIALTSKENVPFLRLVLPRIMEAGKSQNKKNWCLTKLPKPTNIERCLHACLANSVLPDIRLFEELLIQAQELSQRKNLLRNILFELARQRPDAKRLMSCLGRRSVLKTIDHELLRDCLEQYCKEADLKANIEIGDLQKLSVNWQRSVLSQDGLCSTLLSPAAKKHISAHPFEFRASPYSIAFAELKAELNQQKLNASFKLSSFEKIVADQKIEAAFERGFAWERLVSNHVAVEKEKAQPLRPNMLAYEKISIAKAHLYLLHLLSEQDRFEKSKKGICVTSLQKALETVPSGFQLALIRCSRGALQGTIFEQVLSNSKSQETGVCRAFCFGPFNENTNLDSLIFCLDRLKGRERQRVYKKVLSSDITTVALFHRDEEFSAFFLKNFRLGKIQRSYDSGDCLRLHERAPKKAATFFEARFDASVAGRSRVSTQDLLLRIVQYYPKTSAFFFAKREISPALFAKLLTSWNFGKASTKIKAEILSLHTKRGRPALAVAVSEGRIDQAIVDDLACNATLEKMIRERAPHCLPQDNISLEEHLMALVVNPSFISQRLIDSSRSERVACLPKIKEKLGYKTRVFAALELAAHSDVKIFPALLHLVDLIKLPAKRRSYGRRFDHLYVNYELPKKSGGTRQISAPSPLLKKVQRGLLELLYSEDISKAATGFVPGLNIADNAKLHVGKAVVVNADIKSFFPNTTYKQIFNLSFKLAEGQLTPVARRLFCEICCNEGHLATGAPTSPVVSNLILRNFDASLLKISSKVGVNYSRYADDITFSGDDAAVWMLKPLATILSQNGYELDDKKTNIFRKGRRQSVTGLVVNQDVNIARPLKRKLRAAIHRWSNGEEATWNGKPISDIALKGHVAFLRMISPEYGALMQEKLDSCLEGEVTDGGSDG